MPDFGDRFRTLPVYDARTDQVSERAAIRHQVYMLVGPSWKGETPPSITGVIRSSTDYAVTVPRIFLVVASCCLSSESSFTLLIRSDRA
jgi:hypothetical protein